MLHFLIASFDEYFLIFQRQPPFILGTPYVNVLPQISDTN